MRGRGSHAKHERERQDAIARQAEDMTELGRQAQMKYQGQPTDYLTHRLYQLRQTGVSDQYHDREERDRDTAVAEYMALKQEHDRRWAFSHDAPGEREARVEAEKRRNARALQEAEDWDRRDDEKESATRWTKIEADQKKRDEDDESIARRQRIMEEVRREKKEIDAQLAAEATDDAVQSLPTLFGDMNARWIMRHRKRRTGKSARAFIPKYH